MSTPSAAQSLTPLGDYPEGAKGQFYYWASCAALHSALEKLESLEGNEASANDQLSDSQRQFLVLVANRELKKRAGDHFFEVFGYNWDTVFADGVENGLQAWSMALVMGSNEFVDTLTGQYFWRIRSITDTFENDIAACTKLIEQ